MSDTDTLVQTAVAKAKRVQTDAGSVENHSIDELIKAEQHLAGKTRKGTGLKFHKLEPGGTND